MDLGVNIDHVATLRQARRGIEPSVLEAAQICEKVSADGVTVHLREDRRHIQDQDVVQLKEILKIQLNLEMALSEDIINFALQIKPDQVTLVPEKREEITTEGGLDVSKNYNKIAAVTEKFKKEGIRVSYFVEPDLKVVELSHKAGADCIELHTGCYCNAFSSNNEKSEIERIYNSADLAAELGLRLNAGHGLNYQNIFPVLKAKNIVEFNIGHSIISRALFVGLETAIKEMLDIIKGYSK